MRALMVLLDPGLLDTLRTQTTTPPDQTAVNPNQLAGYGALIYCVVAFLGMSMIGKPLWGIVLAAVGLVPWLVLNYPATWGFLIPAGLWYVGWRWGWRTVAGVTLVGTFFVFRVITGADEVGWQYGLLIPAALKDTFMLLLIFGFGFGLLRLLLGPRRMDWLVGSGYHGERRRLRERPEAKRLSRWQQRKRQRTWQQVKDGEKYQPAHAKGKGGKGDPHVDVDAPEGPSPPTDPNPVPVAADRTETLIDGVPLSQYQLGGGLPKQPLWRRD